MRSFQAERFQLLLRVPVSVDGCEALPLLRQVFEGEDGGYRANRDASAAIDAFRWINEELLLAFKLGLVLAGMDAVDRADIHAGGIFRADTRFGDHVSHSTSPFVRRRPGGTNDARRAKFSYTTAPSGATSGMD